MFRVILAIFGIFAASAALAQQPAPQTREIAPEYRELAMKRAKEKAELAACQHKADLAKVSIRDRAKFIIDCLDRPAPPPEAPKQPNQRTL